MRQIPWFFGAIGVLAAAACGDDGSNKMAELGDAGSMQPENENDGDGGKKPAQNDGPCGKGDYPSDGTVNLCGTAKAGCEALSAAKDYTDFYGDVYVTGGTDVTPLSCLESAGTLSFFEMPEMESFEAFKRMANVQLLLVQESPKFTSLAGLKPNTVETLSIDNCGIEEMKGLGEDVELDSITIENNEKLTTLKGLERLKVKDLVVIRDNPKLPECEAKAFAARFPDADSVISGNDAAATCP